MASIEQKSNSQEFLDFQIQQGEKRLTGTCENANSQDSRASTLLNVCTTLSSASAATFAASLFSKEIWLHQPAILTSVLVATLGFTAATFYTVKSMRSQGFHTLGWDAKELSKTEMEIDDSGQKDNKITKTKIYHLNETIKSIKHNDNILKERGNFINRSLFFLVLTPVTSIIVGIIFQYIYFLNNN
jgi:hypothetical protein